MGRQLLEYAPFAPHQPHEGQGSLVAVIATDAPLLPHQLKRLARRGALGMARTGGLASNFSGDLFLAFSTANPEAGGDEPVLHLTAVPNERMDPLLHAAAYAVEEAILNALVAAETMTGRAGLDRGSHAPRPGTGDPAALRPAGDLSTSRSALDSAGARAYS